MSSDETLGSTFGIICIVKLSNINSTQFMVLRKVHLRFSSAYVSYHGCVFVIRSIAYRSYNKITVPSRF